MNDIGSHMKKVTCRYYAYDIEKLKLFYPESGYNQVLRALARRHVRQLEANAAQRLAKAELQTEEG